MSNLTDEQFQSYKLANESWEKILLEIGISPNDQTKARFFNRLELERITGNAYPNKFKRSAVSGTEDTITLVS